MEKGHFKVEGLHGNKDADTVLAALNRVWGVRQADIDLEKAEVSVTYNENSASLHDFHQAVKDSGFGIQI
jgi:copper chaperone CopZ